MMDVLLCVYVLWSLEKAILSAFAQTDTFNFTTSNNESTTVTPTIFDSATPSREPDTFWSVSPETSFTGSNATEPTETATENFTSTSEVNVSLETTTPTTQPTPTVSGSQPLPLSGSLPPPVTDVSSLCPCDLHEGLCDVSCCCDQDCVGDFKLFTECSVEKLVSSSQMCVQDTARYKISTTADGSARVQSSVTQEVNSNVFCIQTANHEAGLSFVPPEVPTDGNFDALFRQFAGFFFDPEGARDVSSEQDLQTVPGYKYGDVILTQEDTGEGGFLRLPTPAGSAHCTDSNPAAFLQDQTSQCVRSFHLEQGCETLPFLNLQTYTGFSVLSAKTGNRTLVGVDLTSVALQSLDGMRVFMDQADGSYPGPALLGTGEGAVCNNVVLQVDYRVTYDEEGEIEGVAASLVLGALDQHTLPMLQQFAVTFAQSTEPREPPSSGNPGYVVGLPLVAGIRTADGVVKSADWNGGLTLFQSSRPDQDCLGAAGRHVPVRFGVNAVSGCTLRLPDPANCSLVSELIFRVLRGPDFPKFVASFGNSPANLLLDWLPIKNRTVSAASDSMSCSIPLSLDLEVKWTKYGSLVNPQAQIVSVTEVIQTNSSSLPSLLGDSDLLPISTSVTFIDVSAAAEPGYRALPTIDAKLPYDFFFPFI